MHGIMKQARQKYIVPGLTGGIAAYMVTEIVRLPLRHGMEMRHTKMP